tara:strand:+ start:521 stop:763 length:243 start_codon:yes stop_codon:yes gene_type:complete
MRKLTIIYATLSLFLVGCTACATNKAVNTNAGVDAHTNLTNHKRQGSEQHRAITINWVNKNKAHKAWDNLKGKKNTKRTL